MVSLEALAHGTPLVCFDIKGLSWLCRSIAYKVKPYDIHALAQAIQLVLKNTKRTDEKRKEGKKYAQQYTWEIIAKQYEQYIDTLNI
jgi:glycosyltransferase involved in cell wall biosynthesis